MDKTTARPKTQSRITGTQLGIAVLLLFFTAQVCYAGPEHNHVHIEQVAQGDNVEINIDQIGYDNTINFSFAHANNTFNLEQVGSGNSISWVSYWGSGKNWGGDVDGHTNDETVYQTGGATYGRHIWGNNNTVDVYQSGTHTHNLDIHSDYVDHESWQEGTGSHYSQTYFYGSADGSQTDITQKGNASHTANIQLQGTQPTNLTLIQQGNVNKTYNITNTCYTTGGCTINVTQGN